MHKSTNAHEHPFQVWAHPRQSWMFKSSASVGAPFPGDGLAGEFMGAAARYAADLRREIAAQSPPLQGDALANFRADAAERPGWGKDRWPGPPARCLGTQRRSDMSGCRQGGRLRRQSIENWVGQQARGPKGGARTSCCMRPYRARIWTRIGVTGLVLSDGVGFCCPGRIRLPSFAQTRSLPGRTRRDGWPSDLGLISPAPIATS